MSIVSVSNIKEYLPELSGSSGADTDLTALRDRVETAVARYLGFPAPDSSLNPVLDVATYTLYIDSPAMYDAYTLQFNSQLGRVYLDPNNAVKTFSTSYRSNKVVITAGYTSITAPDDLEHAICVWASQLHRNKANQGKDQISQANSTVKISPKTMPEEIKEYLNPMRLPGLML